MTEMKIEVPKGKNIKETIEAITFYFNVGVETNSNLNQAILKGNEGILSIIEIIMEAKVVKN